MYDAKAYSAANATSPLGPSLIRRREPCERDVQLEILYCGVCHSDLHQARNDWGGAVYPMVPGHEIVGKVTRVGPAVTKFEVGELVAVASKKDDALRLGAHEVVVSTDSGAMKQHAATFDFILDTVSGEHDINAYLQLLRRDGTVTLVGAPAKPLAIGAFPLIVGRHSVSGSNIGGIAETQEMLEFCAERGIAADVEVIPIQKVNEAFDRLEKSDVKYRFVIDMQSLKV